MMLIALTASTIVTYHLQSQGEAPLELLEEGFPDSIPPGQKSNHEIKVSLVLRQDLESISLDFDCLRNLTALEGDPISPTVESIRKCVQLFEAIDAPYTVQSINVQGGNGTIYDFSRGFQGFAPTRAVLSSTTVYSRVDKGDKSYIFGGVSDFFFNRNRSLEYISLTRNDDLDFYLTMEAGQAGAEEEQSIMEAPLLGRRRYRNGLEDDRLSARFMVNSIGVPTHQGMMEVMRIFVDGESVIARGYLIQE